MSDRRDPDGVRELHEKNRVGEPVDYSSPYAAPTMKAGLSGTLLKIPG